MNTLVSVIMPLYNCEVYVADAIQSVMSQSHKHWELLVIDDCSTDSSYKVVEKLAAQESRIKLFQTDSNSGASAARNYAIRQARGEYIAFLDSDDLWVPEKLEKQLAFMQKKSSMLACTGYWLMDETGIAGETIVGVPANITYRSLLKKNTIGCLTAMYNREALDKRYFDTTLKMHEDYQYWLEMLKDIDHAEGMDIPLAYHRIRTNSLSRNKVDAAYYVWKILRKYQKISWIKTLYYFGYYVAFSLLKYRKIY